MFNELLTIPVDPYTKAVLYVLLWLFLIWGIVKVIKYIIYGIVVMRGIGLIKSGISKSEVEEIISKLK